MVLGLIIAGAIAVLVFVAWLTELTTPIETWIRIASLEYRKNRALKEIRAEGQVTRELIRIASRQRTQAELDQWIAREEKRRVRRHRIFGAGIVSASLLVALTIVVAWPASSPRPTKARNSPHSITIPPSQSSLDAVIAKLAKGECTNFINNYQTNALPQNPKIVPCSRSAATFKAAWLGDTTSTGTPCPYEYSDLAYWTDSSGLTVCMDRIYHVGQCMQGDQVSDAAYAWDYEAVIPCSVAPTAQYPYVVKIVYLYRQNDDFCPDNSVTDDDPANASGLTLCIELWSYYHSKKKN